jgi:hypothetical protein
MHKKDYIRKDVYNYQQSVLLLGRVESHLSNRVASHHRSQSDHRTAHRTEVVHFGKQAHPQEDIAHEDDKKRHQKLDYSHDGHLDEFIHEYDSLVVVESPEDCHP